MGCRFEIVSLFLQANINGIFNNQTEKFSDYYLEISKFLI